MKIRYNRALVAFGIFVILSHNLFAQITVDSSGNVGVGTTSPAAKFVVQSGHTGTAFRLFSDSYGQGVDGANTAVLNLWASEPGVTWYGAGIGNNIKNNGGFNRVTTTRGGSYLRLLDNTFLLNTIDNQGVNRDTIFGINGNVGIGTTTVTHTLTVSGTVRATSFISDTQTYADFVFEPEYELPSLSSVKAHIAEHGHLPDIPSEAEAMEHGVDLAAMQVRLLKKIEELTLHVIRQQEELDELKSRL